MTAVAWAIRVGVAVVLAVAGWSKARSVTSRLDLAAVVGRQWRVPALAARRVVTGLVLAELVAAGALAIPGRTAPVPAVLLLLCLTLGSLRLRRSRRAETCQCFGRSTEVVTGRHVLRNAGLTALAGLSLAVPAGGPLWAHASSALGAGLGLLIATVALTRRDIAYLLTSTHQQPLTHGSHA